jgi:hypothetical protein
LGFVVLLNGTKSLENKLPRFSSENQKFYTTKQANL